MKELEAISLEQNEEISSDAMLYDVEFTLEWLMLYLVNYTMKPFANFQMGTVATSFVAKNDGSYSFNYTLSNMQVDDLVTYNTLFWSNIRSLQL